MDRLTPLDPTDPDVFNQWLNLAVTDTRTLEEYCYTEERTIQTARKHMQLVLKQLYTAHTKVRRQDTADIHTPRLQNQAAYERSVQVELDSNITSVHRTPGRNHNPKKRYL